MMKYNGIIINNLISSTHISIDRKLSELNY